MSEIQRRINSLTGVSRNRGVSRANRNNLMRDMTTRGYRQTGPDRLAMDS